MWRDTWPDFHETAAMQRDRLAEIAASAAKATAQGLTALESSLMDAAHKVSFSGVLISNDPATSPRHRHSYEAHCVSVLGDTIARTLIPAKSPLFCGAFPTIEHLNAVLDQDGRNSRIHIFNRGVAQGLFKRHGGGILEDGVYLIHPKRDDVLVPFRTFHSDMLQEMTREVRVVMGRIGARRLEVETVEGVTFSGSVVSRIPLKSGGVEMEAKEKAERRMTYEWGSPTFEPERALEDCVWIRDNAGAMTIVDQRRTSDLSHFDEFSRVDTSFSVGINLMKLFETNFAWASTSTYRYSVDFFSRRGFHSLWKAMSPWNPRSDASCDPKKEPT